MSLLCYRGRERVGLLERSNRWLVLRLSVSAFLGDLLRGDRLLCGDAGRLVGVVRVVRTIAPSFPLLRHDCTLTA